MSAPAGAVSESSSLWRSPSNGWFASTASGSRPMRRATSRQAFWKWLSCAISSGWPERAAAWCSAKMWSRMRTTICSHSPSARRALSTSRRNADFSVSLAFFMNSVKLATSPAICSEISLALVAVLPAADCTSCHCAVAPEICLASVCRFSICATASASWSASANFSAARYSSTNGATTSSAPTATALMSRLNCVRFSAWGFC